MRRRPMSLLLAAAFAVAGCGSEAASVSSTSEALIDASMPATPVSSSSSTTSSTSTTSTTSTTLALPTEPCERITAMVASASPDTTQVVLVQVDEFSATTATLRLVDRTGDGWSCGTEYSARVGRNGVRPLLDRRSGDGTTPAGVFPLGVMTAWDGGTFSFFGNSPDPGVTAGAYRDVRTGDCFGATPNDPDYGHLVQRSQADCPGPDDEYLPKYTGAYEHAALIGANMEPNVSGDAPGETPYAAAIFLHRQSYDSGGASKPTAGCVSLRHDDLVEVLRALRPGVRFAIGTEQWLLAGDW